MARVDSTSKGFERYREDHRDRDHDRGKKDDRRDDSGDGGAHGGLLSGGQQRRVAIARALLRDTPVLLLDEPTTGLDPATESRLIDDLLAAARGKTLILVTHQPRLTARADRVIQLSDGRITSAGATRVAQRVSSL